MRIICKLKNKDLKTIWRLVQRKISIIRSLNLFNLLSCNIDFTTYNAFSSIWITRGENIFLERRIVKKLAVPEKKLYHPPLLRISIFLKLTPPGFPVKFTVTPPLEFSIFLHWLPWTSMFFPQYGIPKSFTHPPGIFYWYPQQGGFNFFLEKPNATFKIWYNW